MIKTASFFSTPAPGEKRISIALSKPIGFKLRSYQALAPTWSILHEWRVSKKLKADRDHYEDRYVIEVLGKLDHHSTAASLDGCTLCCWEPATAFCHRHIVADWLRYCGYEVPKE